MPLNPGDKVIVLALNKHGVVQSCDTKGIYTILIGSFSTKCKESDLRFVSVKGPENEKGKVTITAHKENPKKLATIDLHGLTVAQALPLVESGLDKAIIAGLDRIEIVHGIGTGKIKEAVHKLLSSVSAVKNFTPHLMNPGVTIVYLDGANVP